MGSNVSMTLPSYFWTNAFSGDNSWFNNLAFVGHFVSAFISIFCLLGIYLMAIQTVFTILFLSNKEFFIRVNEAQNAVHDGDGGFALGMGLGAAKKIYSGQIVGKSTGIGALTDIFYLLIPNILKYSEYANWDDLNGSLSQEDSLGGWFIKTFPKKILMVFILAATYQGYTFEAYGQITEGLGVVAQKMVSFNVAGWVESRLDAGSNYQFSIGDTGKPLDQLRQQICQEIYSNILQNTSINSTQDRLALGQKIQQIVTSQITNEAILANIKNDRNQTVSANNYDSITYQESMNTSQGTGGAGAPVSIPFSDFGVTSPAYVMHFYFRVKDTSKLLDYKLSASSSPNNTSQYVNAGPTF